MTIRNLDALFAPRAIALIGASNEPGSVGAVLAKNLLESGFAGPVMPVNPHERSIRTTLSYRSVSELPVPPDLAVIATPAGVVPKLVGELGARGCRAAVIISAGFGAGPGSLREQVVQAARPNLLRIVGPNCLGFMSPGLGLNASFAHLPPKPGRIALVAQSGAIAAAALDWAAGRGIGFSHIITIGDCADVDFGDLLDYLALDAQTEAVLLYVESLSDARKFMSAGRIAARAKPVVVIKAGRGEAGAKAAFSHTGALAGADVVYDAAFRRAGMLRVTELRELFDAVTTLTAGLAVGGDRLAILTNGGGAGVMAADTLESLGGRLAPISAAGQSEMAARLPLHAACSNPVDILGDAQADRYRLTLKVLQGEPDVDAVLVLNCPTAVADSGEAASAVVGACQESPASKPLLTCWLGDRAVAEGRRRLAAAGIPTHETPDEAVKAFLRLASYTRNQQLLLQTPAVDRGPREAAAAREVVTGALADGRTTLTDPEARAVLKAYGIPVVESAEAPTAEAAGDVAERLGVPVALKILSPDISHKTDVGGVALNLVGAAAVAATARAMAGRIAAEAPAARLRGFIVEPMVRRPKSEELIAGIVRDPTFGPAILFGQGGVAVEVDQDRAMGLAPLDNLLARDMVSRTRVSRRLAGYRDRPAANMDAIADVLINLAALALDLPEVVELDINPLLADADGVMALDARVRVGDPDLATRPAICPYPQELAHGLDLADARLNVRPVRPADAPALVDMVADATSDDVRLRFGLSFRQLPSLAAQRLSHIDYDREMALVAEVQEGDVVGVARLAADPEGETAEFALMVRSGWQDRGLGRRLLEDLLAHAVRRGLKRIWGEVALDNGRMLLMADAFGFKRAASADPGRIQIVKTLD